MQKFLSIQALLLLYFSVFPFFISFSQSLSGIEKISEDPDIDGSPFESVWENISPKVFFMLNPVSGITPTQKSEAKVCFNDKYLFVAGYMYDNEPDKIRANSKKRDEMSLTNDFFGISLDTYNDDENAMFFTTTPSGLRLDAQISNDGQSLIPLQSDWNTMWEVETSINSMGWFIEMRIPLSSLRYYTKEGKVTMGISFFRYISRLAEWDIYPMTSNEWGFWSFTKPSQYENIEIAEIKSVNPLSFSPYLLSGIERQSTINESETSYKTTIDWEKQAGMDVKIGLSKSMTLDITANTDFAQVEADDQQVNLTRFSLFFPEKRQFFLERSSIFDFNFGTTGQLFYSRRIGLNEDRQVPILGGARLTGRTGLWDIGFMSLQTGSLKDNQTNEVILPSSNSSIARLRRKIPVNTNSYIGALFTSKVDVDGKYYLSYGLDGIINLFKNDYLNINIASTTESNMGKKKHISDMSKLFIQWERRTYKGFSYDLNYTISGNSFNPALGFQYRNDFSRYGAILGYGFIPGGKSKFLNQYKFIVNAYTYFRNIDNKPETVSIIPTYTFTTKKDHGFTLSLPTIFEYAIDTFNLSKDVFVPAGSYSFSDFKLVYNTPHTKLLFLSTSGSTGRYYDGWKNSFSVSPSFTPGNSWIIGISYVWNEIEFIERDQRFLSHLVLLNLQYMYSTTISASSFIQYNNQTEKVIWNARFRYNPKEGNDLYLVYNDLINSLRADSDPILPFSSQRTILIKYTHTFRIR